MVKYTIAMLLAMVDANPNSPIENIHKHPTFRMLWNLQRQIINDICKVGNFKPPLDGYSGYVFFKRGLHPPLE